MNSTEWQPHVTVATVVERNGKFLLVEEHSGGQQVFNQPAGHLDPNENLSEAAARECLEETGWVVEIEGVVGMALYHSPNNGVTYHRSTFYGRAVKQLPDAELDDGIIAAHWLDYDEIVALSDRMRSALVIAAIDQYREGHRYPLSMIYDHRHPQT